MKRSKYEWKEEAPRLYKRLDASRVGMELEKIKSETGDLHPAAVVRYAKSPKSAMHNFFQWNDSKAADRFRESQARHLIVSIREIKITVINKKTKREIIRPWFPKKPGSNKGYWHSDEIKKDHERIQDTINRAQIDLEGWMKRYEQIHEQFDEIYEDAKVSYRKPSHARYHK